MAKKLSTQDILAKARAEAAGEKDDSAAEQAEQPKAEATDAEAPPAADASDDSAAEEAEAAPAEKSDVPQAAPKSTKDVLAAARAQAAGGDSGKPASKAQAAGGESPQSTKDILAAARAQAGGEKDKPAAAKPAGGEGAKSTKDILAAARAQASGEGAAETPAAKKAAPAEKKAAAKASPKAPAAKPAGDRPSVQEMVKAAREGRKLDTEEKPAAPVAPAKVKRPIPARPAGKKESDEQVSRRFAVGALLFAVLASPFALAWWAFGLASGLFSLALLRFMMPNVLVEPPTRFKVGPPSDYPLDVVSTKWKAQYGVWMVHTMYEGRSLIYALSTVCTHLGCTPNWLEGEQKFKCPCHGSGFYITGVNFEGPAPRPLERHGIRVAPDGMLEVDKSVKFQQEMGQWEDAASFVEVV